MEDLITRGILKFGKNKREKKEREKGERRERGKKKE